LTRASRINKYFQEIFSASNCQTPVKLPNAGANDYILRPFTSRELLNRINALLRAQKR
jgi:DNA-binding response OmpR family regulator